MCGILGFFGAFEPAALRVGLAAIAHRGPDDSGVFIGNAGTVGLGHVRLAIQDLSPLGHQPMLGADGAVVLVFNGEIYNFRDLRRDLERRGHQFRGHSDTEVLLNLYLAEGEAFLNRLNGIFALAMWDARTQELLLARDAMGVKPLYVATTTEGLAFGSEIKGLMPLLSSTRELDAASLHRYLSFLWCPGAGTPLKNVRKLLPGEAMIVRAGRVCRQWEWQRLPVFRLSQAIVDERACVSGTVDHLRQAVHRQLVADVPVGAFLSGGLDSSAVVAFAREQQPDIQCFTIEAPGAQEEGATNDLPYARKVAQHLGVRLEVVQVDATRMAGGLEEMVAQLDEPLADPAPLNVFYISQLARRAGMKVLLSGAGGDDLFTGYRRHRAVQMEPYWSWLPVGARDALEGITAGMDQRNPFARRLAKLFNGAGLSGDRRLANYFVWTKESELFGLYAPEFRAEVAGTAACAPLLDFLQGLDHGVPPLERMLALEKRFFLADHNLTYTDKMSMAAGVEVRVPFLDLDLVNFAQRIPVAMKQSGPQGKWILKKAMEPYLPSDVIYRPKSGFGAPLRRWMRHELRELLGDMLSVESLRKRGLFEPVAVQKLIAANDAGKVDAAYTLLSLLCIEIWCRRYIDSTQSAIPRKEVVLNGA
jgi:asparagine synthase (glutamine-hydrolysing)